MANAPSVRERTMKVREVLLRAVSRELTWIQAAEILGVTARTMRRWKLKFERRGIEGLVDGRTKGHPSPNKIRRREVEKLLRLFRDRYRGLNVRHFCSIARREHGLQWSYSYVRQTLQAAGLVKKHRPRGRHHMRRPPRSCFGEMLHLDGSLHAWLALKPGEFQCLIAVVDDATRRLLYAQLTSRESTQGVMAALHAVLIEHGVPQVLYTDRASWAAWTPRSGAQADRDKPTQVGRALARLGIEHILAYSPQARGRGERVNRTLQDRLVQELRLARIQTLEGANRYLTERFIPGYNEEFARAPADSASAFVTVGGADLNQILCHEEQRTVGRDNTVTLDNLTLQIAKQPGRPTCAGLLVLARRHLDGSHSVWWGRRCLGTYDAKARALTMTAAEAA